MVNNSVIFYSLIVLLNLSSCMKSLQDLPAFDKKRAFNLIQQQVDMGPRVPYSNGHDQCKTWIVDQLNALQYKVNLEPFSGRTFTGVELKLNNITASLHPEIKKRIVLATHYDTRPIAENDKDVNMSMKAIPGADDGASGVAVLLEIARCIKQKPIENFDIDFVFLDASDEGDDTGMNVYSWGLGSQEWSKNVAISKKQKPDFCIFLNMVGSKNLRITQEGGSMRFAKDIMNKIFAQAKDLGFEAQFPREESQAIVEDHVFAYEHLSIPCLLLMNNPEGSKYAVPPHMHTHQDKMDIIDEESLYKVGTLLLHTIYAKDQEK